MTTSTQSRTGAEPAPVRAPQSFDVMMLVRRVLRRPHIAAVGMCLGIGSAVVLMHHVKPRYTSSALMLLDPRPPGSFGAESSFASIGIDAARVDGVVQIMQSADTLMHVVRSEHLEDDPEFAAARSSRLHNLMQRLHVLASGPVASDSNAARRLRAMANLARSLKVTRVGFTYVIRVSVTAGSAEKARRLANAVATTYLTDQSRSKAAAVQRDHAWLTSRLAQTQKALKEGEQNVEAVRRKYGIAESDAGQRANTFEQSVQQMNAQLLQAQTDVAGQRANYEQALSILKGGGDIGALLEASNSAAVDDLVKQRNAAMRQLAKLSSVDTSANPAVINALHDKEAMDSVIHADGERYVAQLHDQLAIAEAREKALVNQIARKTAEATSGPKADGYIELRDARRTVDIDQSLYHTYLSKLQEVDQQLTRQDPEARIISPAALPDSPSFPNPILFLAGGAFLGMVSGGSIALLRPLPEKGFTKVTDLEKRLFIALLGVLPEIKRNKRATGVSPSYISNYLVVRPFSQFSECLRALRASLRIGMANGPHVLQVTSATAGEGKTTVAASLAISAALAGIRTALVDLDVRNPSISELFDLHESEGLMEILQDRRPTRDVGKIHRDLPLSIIPAGQSLPTRPDMIASRQLAGLIDEVRRDNELVILDAPPILAVSDPLFTGNLADATLLVVAFGDTPQPAVEQAVETLLGAGVPLAGAVLNKVTASRSGSQFYGYGGYGRYGGSTPSAPQLEAPSPSIRRSGGSDARQIIDGNL